MDDLNEIMMLLHIEEKLRAHGRRFQNIHKKVLARLSELNGPVAESELIPGIYEAPPQGNTDLPNGEETTEWPETSSANTDVEAANPSGRQPSMADASIRRT